MTSEIKVGVLFVVGVATLFVFTVLISGMPFLGKGFAIEAEFPDAGGIDRGDKVLFAGVVVGEVERVFFDGTKVVVRCRIRRDDVRIPKDSTFSIRHSTLLGGLVVYIEPGRARQFLKANQRVRGLPPQDIVSSLTRTSESIGSLVRSVQDKLDSVVKEIRKALTSFTEGDGTLQKLLKDKKLYEELKQVAENARRISDDLRAGRGTIGKLLASDSVFNDAKSTLSELKTAVADAKKMLSDIKRSYDEGRGLFALLKDKEIVKSVRRSAKNLEKVTEKLSGATEGDSLLAVLLKPGGSQILDDLSAAMTDLKDIFTDIREGKGLLPTLIRDESLAKDAKDAVASAKSVIKRLDQAKEGSLWKFITEPGFYRKANKVLKDAEEALAPIARLRVFVGVGSWRYEKMRMTTYPVYLRLYPTSRRYFLLGATFFHMDNDSPVIYDVAAQERGKTLAQADFQLAWLFNLGPHDKNPANDVVLTPRGGLIEGKFGLGLDLDFLGWLRFSVEGRDVHTDTRRFYEDVDPFMLRAYLTLKLSRYIRIYLGGSNLLDTPEFCGGVVIEWEDKDIKSIVGIVGALQ